MTNRLTIGSMGFDPTTKTYPRNLNLAVANPDHAMRELDAIEAEDSLLKFIEMHWSVLEPTRPFIKGYVIEAICDHLEAISRGEIKKLLINVPPGCMKSMTTNVFFPAWEWGPRRMPGLRYIGASYSQSLTIRDNRRCRQLIGSPQYQDFWGGIYQIEPDQDAKGKYETTARGWKIATSVGGVGTGERGDRFIIDDPHNIKDAESEAVRESTLQWFTEVVPTRVNDAKDSAFIVIMQRVHSRDVSGLILANEMGYEHLCLPMEYDPRHKYMSNTSLHFIDWRSEPGELLWPERFPSDAVDDLKNALRAWGGSYAEAGQLQQIPSPRGGGMFKKKWWRFYETSATGYIIGRPEGCYQGPAVPYPSEFDWILLTCDAAFKGETGKKKHKRSRVSVIIIGGIGAQRYILANETRVMSFKETCDTIVIADDDGKFTGGLLFKWQCDKVLIEDKANGSAIIDTLSALVPGLIAIQPQGGKESRAQAMQPSVEAGQYFLPDGAPWVKDYVDEFATFPVGDFDDQVDATSQAHIHMTNTQDMMRAIAMAKL